MIIPSIDLMGGQAVQLVGGKEHALDAGDPRPIAERFRLAGEIAVIDLDAALGQGSNAALIEDLCTRARCRVGGGIRDLATARRWLDAGAEKIILGTAARPELLSQLPRQRLIAALDAVDGEVVVEGWRTRTGARIEDRMAELGPHVSGFLVTFVEREGRMGGTALERVAPLVAAAGQARLTIAGGVTTPGEIATLDRLGADAQVGMALYTGAMDLASAIAAPLVSDRPDGLWATVVVDEHGTALGLSWSNLESLRAAVQDRKGVYFSRKRGLWRKGETSGATQDLLRVDLDCDRDALRFTVRQAGQGFCHQDTWTCWGEDGGLPALARKLASRLAEAPAGSYTRRLLDDPELLGKKLVEEAGELAAAGSGAEVAWEVADLIYFALVAMVRAGVPLSEVEAELERRARAVTRRAGDAKPSGNPG
jgi:phosphoribosyl-ATP pyrophosphohydrolase/phosphoribosyl-AMP cyclohydrolase